MSELRLPTEDGTHCPMLRDRALSNVVGADLYRCPSVRDSSARLVSVNPLAIDAQVTTSLSCDLKEWRNRVATVAERLDHVLGRSDVRMRLRLTFTDGS